MAALPDNLAEGPPGAPGPPPRPPCCVKRLIDAVMVVADECSRLEAENDQLRKRERELSTIASRYAQLRGRLMAIVHRRRADEDANAPVGGTLEQLWSPEDKEHRRFVEMPEGAACGSKRLRVGTEEGVSAPPAPRDARRDMSHDPVSREGDSLSSSGGSADAGVDRL